MEPKLEKWSIKDVKLWEKNPRRITNDGIQRLMEQIKELGQYKPIIVNSGEYWGEKGLIAGGNMRYQALRNIGIEYVFVSLISPKSEDEFIKYALSDNDRAGYYDIDLLGNIVTPDFNLSGYAVDVSPAVNLDGLVHTAEFDPNAEWGGMPEFTAEDKSAYKNLIVNFENEKDMEKFAKLVGQEINIKTKSIWYPEHKTQKNTKVYKTTKDEK